MALHVRCEHEYVFALIRRLPACSNVSGFHFRFFFFQIYVCSLKPQTATACGSHRVRREHFWADWLFRSVINERCTRSNVRTRGTPSNQPNQTKKGTTQEQHRYYFIWENGKNQMWNASCAMHNAHPHSLAFCRSIHHSNRIWRPTAHLRNCS